LLPDSIQKSCRRPFASSKTHAPRRSLVTGEAKIALEKFLQIKPDFSLDAGLAAFSPFNPKVQRPLFKTYFEGLREAGLDVPDEPTVAD
jgi:hypothetical protein